jgi:hypothetical protein
MAATSTRSRPLTGDRLLVLPRPAQLAIKGAADQPDRRGRLAFAQRQSGRADRRITRVREGQR